MTKTEEDTYVGHLHRGSISATTQWSIDELLMREPSVRRTILRQEALPDAGSGWNRIVEIFLMTGNPWLLLVDDGVGFMVDALSRLKASADPDRRPVVSALAYKATPTGLTPEHGIRYQVHPAAYEWVVRDDRAAYEDLGPDHPTEAMFECDAVDALCLLIHRNLLAAMVDIHGKNWFSPLQHSALATEIRDGQAFCYRVLDLGSPVSVRADVEAAQEYRAFLDEDAWLAERREDSEPPPAVIIGTGRSGSGYIAQVLGRCGLVAGHEDFWNPHNRRRPGLQVDSSWLAVPALEGYGGVVIHQVRDPLAVLSSLLNGDLRSFGSRAQWDFMVQHVPEMATMDEEEGFMRFISVWAEMADSRASFRYRVEDLDADLLVELVTMIGGNISLDVARAALDQVPTSFNRHAPGPDLDIADLPTGEIRDAFLELRRRYGYSEEAERR